MANVEIEFIFYGLTVLIDTQPPFELQYFDKNNSVKKYKEQKM